MERIDFDLLLGKISANILSLILKLHVFLIKNRILSIFFIIATIIFLFKDKKITIVTLIISFLFFVIPFIIKRYLNNLDIKLKNRKKYLEEIIKMEEELLEATSPEEKIKIVHKIKEKGKDDPDKKAKMILRVIVVIILLILILMISYILIESFEALMKLLIKNRAT